MVLVLTTVAGLGCYYEANDDATIAWLFTGVLALKPVLTLPLYFHGLGRMLVAAYGMCPGVAWFGVFIATLLGAATVLLLAVLDGLLESYFRPGQRALLLTTFFGVALLENWLLFSYVRVALLLAGAGLLFAAQRPGRIGPLLLGLSTLGIAWLMRPSLAMLGLGASVPAVLLLARGWRRAAPLLLSAVLVLGLATSVAALLRTPAETRAQVRDAYFARILDFEQLQPRPLSAADSLGTAALDLWIMGDSTVVNEALSHRAYIFDAPDFWARIVPAKLMLRAGLLVRDYFPLLLLLAATVFASRQWCVQLGWFWLVQLGFVSVLGLFAGVLKLPPRLALPLLLLWVLTNLAFLLPAKPPEFIRLKGTRRHQLATILLILILFLYAAKTWHRYRVLGQERHRHETALATLRQLSSGQIRIMAGTNDWLKSLSPFRVYPVGPGPVLLLTGWHSHDASQAALRRALAGSSDQTACLRYLTTLPNDGPAAQTLWVLTPETAAWLSRRFRLAGAPFLLQPKAGMAPFSPDSPARVYEVQNGLKP